MTSICEVAVKFGVRFIPCVRLKRGDKTTSTAPPAASTPPAANGTVEPVASLCAVCATSTPVAVHRVGVGQSCVALLSPLHAFSPKLAPPSPPPPPPPPP